MTVRIEENGPITTVVLSRPEVKNVADRPTAGALLAAFRAFGADSEAKVAVLSDFGGHHA